MNWVTFNYRHVYLCICDAKYSLVLIHSERFQEIDNFETSVVFLLFLFKAQVYGEVKQHAKI